MTEKLLGLKEVAKILGVTPLTLRNWDKKGRLVAYRNPINNYRVYRYADIADLLAAIHGQTQPVAVKPVQRLAVRVEDDAVEREPAADLGTGDAAEEAV